MTKDGKTDENGAEHGKDGRFVRKGEGIGIELEPSENGDFYTINNGGIFRESYLKKKETLWSAPYAQTPPQDTALSSDAETDAGVLSENAGRDCSKGFGSIIEDVFIPDNKRLSIFDIVCGSVFDTARTAAEKMTVENGVK